MKEGGEQVGVWDNDVGRVRAEKGRQRVVTVVGRVECGGGA